MPPPRSRTARLRSALALVLTIGAPGLSSCRTARPPAAPARPPEPLPAAPGAAVAACGPDNALPPRLVRLAHSELVAHLAATLGDEVVRGPDAPVFVLQGEHTQPADERILSSVDFGSYRNAARTLARRYVRALPADDPCVTPAGLSTCVHGPLRTLMQRLHRGDLDADTWLRLSRAFLALAPEHGPAQALETVLGAALLSPAVLYRAESVDAGAGQPDRLPRAQAVDLASFALLGGPAPAELRDELTRLEEPDFQPHLARVARRWTASPAFQARAIDFVRDWLGVSHLRDKLIRPKVANSRGDGTPDMSEALLAEFDAFVRAHFLGPEGGFARLFTATETRYLPELERIYGGTFLPPDRIVWDPRERKGVLGTAGLLAAHASENASDPVQRGMLIRLRILCEPLPPPIPNADINKVGITPQMQTRERFEALASAPACKGCHLVINPPGYLFESFDQFGRFRRVENGRPVNDAGGIPAFFGDPPYPGSSTAWSGITALADWLAESPRARQCFAKEFANYLLAARVFDRPENCALGRIAARFVASGRLPDLVEDLVASDLFRTRAGAPAALARQ